MNQNVLVTGASGHVGGRLVSALIRRGVRVRVITRDAARLSTDWADQVEVVEGDLGDPVVVHQALEGVGVAYYLVHSMDGADFAERDRLLATGFGQQAKSAGVQRIVYLSGLHPTGEELSPHLRSRVEVGQILLDSGVPTAVLQAAVVLGLGSVSFDMLRYLTTRLPAMIAPKWLDNRIQPIAIDDAVHYLTAARALPPEVNRTFDIGGPDVLTYRQMMQRFAAVTGLRKRVIVTVPVLTPRLASHWIGTVTPVNTHVAKPLVDSLVHEVVCDEHDLEDLVSAPPGGARSFDDAVRDAMSTAQPDRAPRTLAVTSAAVLTTAVIGGIATTPTSGWYRRLDKPVWQPPGPAFGAVWTPLYLTIAGISTATLVKLDEDNQDAANRFRIALGANLFLNTAWSWIFWRSRRLDLAAAEAALLAISSGDLARRAGQVSRRNGLALTPYAAWCTFATALSAELARRNR